MSVAAPSLKGWYTTQEVAARYGVPPRAVLRMIRLQRLPAHKIGWVWVLHESELPGAWPPPAKTK